MTHEPMAGGHYPGDTGELDLETRRAFVQLLKGPLVTAAKHPEVWRAVIRDERLLRSRLADVFLDLVIDDENELAFTRPAETGNANTPTVLRTERLTFMDTVMLLALRQRLLRAQPGERVMVDLDELREQLELYRTAGDTDPAGYAKRINASWKKLDKYSLLTKTSTDDRMEISPVLRQLFDAEQVALVEVEFRRILEEDTP
ncbi:MULTISPECIES: DUF4194 domain-containing protein [Rhodococcus]|uniref:DUF4194 domain-containing protein n=1 Tax=Rhodococcus TaxID=1827 RepID=UPI0010624A12|nr:MULTISPECIES: DUF4194 domain-containing protein [Rhodococcus]MDI9935707.1 DUF4194 domain-containing protein [Rhodococcus sp. IEGM 1351]NHU47448.1 DUF4194 domain-containing protein [Rhodococcus sp. A14]UZG53875.1 DUF4194 domain-containing protein [Rhodococcus opacus]